MKAMYNYLKRSIPAAGLLLMSLISFSQVPAPEYSFTSPALVSGAPNAVGSIYRFSAVKPGIDALVTITAAVNATLAILDQTAAMGGGYDAAFQPNITVTSLTTGYVDFKIDFVLAATSTVSVQPGVNITALDVDGYNFSPSLRLYEFEEFDMGASSSVYYYFTGIDLSISYSGTGFGIRGTNIRGIEYGAINTSQNVRFTMYTPLVSSVRVRSGAINADQFNNVTRQRSFYFARFAYTNLGVLSKNDLRNFSGSLKNNRVQLNWELIKEHKLARVELERSADNRLFERIADVNTTGGTNFNTVDNTIAPGNNYYYRLKLYEANGTYSYSNVLMITVENAAPSSSFKIWPTVVSGQATMSVTSVQALNGSLSVADASGRVHFRKTINIREGTTISDLPEIARLKPGNYMVVLNAGTLKMTQQVIVTGSN